MMVYSSSDLKDSFARGALLSLVRFSGGGVDWEGISMVSFTGSFDVVAISFKGSFSGLEFACG